MGGLIAINLVEPHSSVTYFNQLKYNELISAMQLLYNQLITCDPQKVLNISSPSLKFVSQEHFSDCSRWPKKVLQKLKLLDLIELKPRRVQKILQNQSVCG